VDIIVKSFIRLFIGQPLLSETRARPEDTLQQVHYSD
jgi:hypothetical protein